MILFKTNAANKTPSGKLCNIDNTWMKMWNDTFFWMQNIGQTRPRRIKYVAIGWNSVNGLFQNCWFSWTYLSFDKGIVIVIFGVHEFIDTTVHILHSFDVYTVELGRCGRCTVLVLVCSWFNIPLFRYWLWGSDELVFLFGSWPFRL